MTALPMKTLIIVCLTIVFGVALGTVFSKAYPTIEIDAGLALLAGVAGLLIALFIVLAGPPLWRALKGDNTSSSAE